MFCTGINLTHLYQGKISYLWYLVRDLGFINKIYRGLAMDGITPDELLGDSIEKPFMAVIGGGCQYLPATDYVLGADDAYMTLPARIIPGVANLPCPASSATASAARPSCTIAGSTATASRAA